MRRTRQETLLNAAKRPRMLTPLMYLYWSGSIVASACLGALVFRCVERSLSTAWARGLALLLLMTVILSLGTLLAVEAQR